MHFDGAAGQGWADPPLGKLLLTVIGGFAEFERSLIKARVATKGASLAECSAG
jgi:DNA invertase Pin-like site-specific DNA recombinase